MKDITKNEMLFVLSILKNPETEYNSNNIAKHIGISAMGALKIAKRLEKEQILILKKLGKASFFRLNTNNDYLIQYLKFLLKRESEQEHPYVKRWVQEARKIKNAGSIILFGSVIKKHEEARDIDILIVTDQNKFQKLKKEIEEINLVNNKKMHPIYQTEKDLKDNIKKRDKVILSAIKGIVVFGEEKFINLIEK
ncbi:nucleotidyltransferase domain-containing protein [Candidatus Pacearchaeota archaeon]|nr:nucleotidyltransferase domain-containing protein [Candidatus Pacearchaeota archaeon]